VTFTVSVSGSSAGNNGSGRYQPGTGVTISAGVREGYIFTGWTASGVTLSDESSATTSFAMPANNVSVTAGWKVAGTADVDVTVVGGVTVADVDGDSVTDALDYLDEDDPVLTIAVNLPAGGRSAFEISVPADAIGDIVDADAALAIDTELAHILFNTAALESITDAGGDTVTISGGRLADTDPKVPAAFKGKPVYEFKAQVDGENVDFTPGSRITVKVPYTIGKGENPNAIIVNYLKADGTMELVQGYYEDGFVIFTVSHFSVYGVRENQPPFFTDMPARYRNEIMFIAAREITVGIGGGLFGSSRDLTRAELVIFAMKAGGFTAPDADWRTYDNFADAKGKWYEGWIATAKEHGIVAGYTPDTFNGDQYITREEALILIHNILTEYFGETLRPVAGGKSLEDFEDADELSDWVKENHLGSIEELTLAGLYTWDTLDPQGSMTRAEMAHLLTNFIRR
jgi:uncharacterized repeat protein (TIGR02543 family)